MLLDVKVARHAPCAYARLPASHLILQIGCVGLRLLRCSGLVRCLSRLSQLPLRLRATRRVLRTRQRRPARAAPSRWPGRRGDDQRRLSRSCKCSAGDAHSSMRLEKSPTAGTGKPTAGPRSRPELQARPVRLVQSAQRMFSTANIRALRDSLAAWSFTLSLASAAWSAMLSRIASGLPTARSISLSSFARASR